MLVHVWNAFDVKINFTNDQFDVHAKWNEEQASVLDYFSLWLSLTDIQLLIFENEQWVYIVNLSMAGYENA